MHIHAILAKFVWMLSMVQKLYMLAKGNIDFYRNLMCMWYSSRNFELQILSILNVFNGDDEQRGHSVWIGSSFFFFLHYGAILSNTKIIFALWFWCKIDTKM